ncbi:M20 family metallopeptidase [Microbacterium sp. Root280D1]|uniref:M20 family metallopeptidase n=1 Tax=Microbacterium sp. Root280D1 TaxID=1736510 RepID=UPI0006FB2FF6|nr:M20 family metallopeptidase [Microbacterium sp. Root280D1]KRD53932.1 peptidase M20 [Microbacterium sp. Root280D1]
MTLADPSTRTLLDLAEAKQRSADAVRTWEQRLVEISHEIHDDPEIAFEEVRAANLVAAALRDAGFTATVGAFGVDTAIDASFGDGEFVVAICAEYDALPVIGHACGHNVIAAAGLGAAIALAAIADDAGLTVKLLGTPAEEHGGGKVLMLEGGAWEDATVSLMVHGAPGIDVRCESFATQAVDRFQITYTGRPAHAAAAPDKGVNALDAATIALTSIGLLRQQLPGTVRTAAVITQGGEVTNIIPARTVLQAEVRSFDLDELRDAKRRVMACFEAGALAAGCSWEQVRTEPRYDPLVQEPLLADAWNDALTELGREPIAFSGMAGGSTDMGNVSQVVPSIHPGIAIIGSSSAPHTEGFAADAATPAADRAVVDAAIGLAWAAATAALTPESRSDLLARQAARPAGATTHPQGEE